MPVDTTTFRDALANVATSVSVVTTVDERLMPHGMTVGSVCSLSAVPPLVLVCVDHGASAHRALCTADRFLINVLSDRQSEVARRFARSGVDRFIGEPQANLHGLPAVPGALAWLLCERHALVAAGDHTIVIGRVDHAESGDGRPLLYFGRAYRRLPHDDNAELPLG